MCQYIAVTLNNKDSIFSEFCKAFFICALVAKKWNKKFFLEVQ